MDQSASASVPLDNMHLRATVSAKTAAPLILVVEDDPQILQFVAFALEDEGFEVVTAVDGREAVEVATLRRPSLIVLDMSLPRLSGEGVASELRVLYGNDLPILVVTADNRASERARHVGAFAYLRKPFDLDNLIRLIQDRLAS